MPSPQPDPAELKAMQDDIYREKILRARGMTMVERFEAGLQLSNDVFGRMLEGAMWQLDTSEEEQGWREVKTRLERLRKMKERARPDLEPHQTP